MKKNELLLLGCLLCCAVGYAQKQEWNADTIMKRARAVEATWTSIGARLETTTVKDTVIDTRKGTFSWQWDRMNMSYYDSAGKLTFQIIQVIDTIWIYDRELNRMNVQMVVKSKDRAQVGGLFYPSVNSYKSPILKQIIGDSIAVITVYPVHPDKVSWNQMDIRVDLKTYNWIGFKTFQKDRSRITFSLEYISINTALSPDLFLFDPKNYPDGLEILDHRKE